MIALGLALMAAIVAQEPAPKPVVGQSADTLTPGSVVLLANRDRGDTHAADIVRAALSSPDPLVRRAAARVASVAHPDAYEALLHALADEKDPRVAGEFITDALALGGKDVLPRVEPMAQRLGAAGVQTIAGWYARADPEEFLTRLTDWSRTRGAEDRLAVLVAMVAAQHPELRERLVATWKPIASAGIWKRTTEAFDRAVTMRTPPGLAAQVLPSTLTAARCTGHRDTIASALIMYAASGRPTRIELNVGGLSAACRDALSAIARISLDEPNSGGQPQTVIVPMTPEFVSCVAQADANVEPHPTSAAVTVPTLTKQVRPEYTRAAMDRRAEGAEELDAILSSTGCVQYVEVTRELDPDLDRQGIIAVLQWRFRPAMLEGTPVPVLISVELTFTLRR
jgi:Gram-negative bacterial TonB protein C-terminal